MKTELLGPKDLFKSDTAKVNYVISYLKGIALDCFEPEILDPIEIPWLMDSNLNVNEPQVNFRPHDPKGKAGAELEQLCMQENHQAMKYFTKFQQLATQVQWGEAAL